MTTINLYQSQEERQNSLGGFNKGLFFSLGILIITLLVLVGLKISVQVLKKQNEKALAKVQAENANIVTFKNLDQVVDMQTRLEKIKEHLQIENNKVSLPLITEILNDLGTDIGKGVVVSSFQYDNDGKILLEFNSSNFSDVAQQVFNFKSSNNFTNVSLGKIKREEGNISCAIEMKVK